MYQAAELIGVGTELLLGNIANTDAQMISRALSAAGINVLYHTVVGDNASRLEQAVDIARARADLLIFTGGLGPTYDDMTKASVCRALGVKLVYHPEIEEEIRRFIDENYHIPMTDCNRQQAWLPEGCTIFHNPVGTAPACAVKAGGVTAVLLPGVPRECAYLLEHEVMPYLTRGAQGVIVSHNVRVFGLGEPKVQERLAAIMNEAVNPSVAPYAKTGEVLVRLTAKACDAEAGEAMLRPLLCEVLSSLGDYAYGVDVMGLEEAALALLREKGLTFSTAESCTGGLIAKRITDLPGASAVFCGGVVSYTNGVKQRLLGVDEALLEKYGAVSRPVAEAMARGVRQAAASDLSVAVTGVAGPDRDDRGNEVGTVFVALSAPEETFVRALHLPGDRELVRIFSAHHAFDMLRRYLSGKTI